MGASGVIVDWTNCEAQRAYPPPWQPGGMAECVACMPTQWSVTLRFHSFVFTCVVFHLLFFALITSESKFTPYVSRVQSDTSY